MIINAYLLNELDNYNQQLIINLIYKYSDIFFINQIFALYNDEKYGFNFPNNYISFSLISNLPPFHNFKKS